MARQNKARWDPQRSIFGRNELNSGHKFNFRQKLAQFSSRLRAQFWTQLILDLKVLILGFDIPEEESRKGTKGGISLSEPDC